MPLASFDFGYRRSSSVMVNLFLTSGGSGARLVLLSWLTAMIRRAGKDLVIALPHPGSTEHSHRRTRPALERDPEDIGGNLPNVPGCCANRAGSRRQSATISSSSAGGPPILRR